MIELQPDLELTVDEAERVLCAWLGESVTCSRIEPLKGGLVNSVFRLDFDRSPFRAVVKIHGTSGHSFTEEARALHHLATKTSCPVPRVFLTDDSGDLLAHAFLLLECVPGRCLHGLELDRADRDAIDIELARLLSDLHTERGVQWGGITVAPIDGSWNEVFAQRLADVRAEPGVRTRLEPEVVALVDEAIALAPSELTDAGEPTLVHGDVWEGNLMVRHEHGRWTVTGLLDPKLQFADVELELAYLEVFDNDRGAFFAAYHDRHPRRQGYERRRLFYWLETALHHVALFEEQFFRDFTARTAAAITKRQMRRPDEGP